MSARLDSLAEFIARQRSVLVGIDLGEIAAHGGQGLGLAYAKALAAAGASVVVNDVNADTAASAGASITDAGGTAALQAAAAKLAAAEKAEAFRKGR